MGQDKLYKTTKKHFEIFKKEMLKWVNILGLTDWEWFFIHKSITEDAQASVRYNREGRLATVALEPYWYIPVKTRELQRTAFHETIEVLLADYVLVAASRQYNPSEEETERHRIIRRLENSFFTKK